MEFIANTPPLGDEGRVVKPGDVLLFGVRHVIPSLPCLL